MMDRGTSIPWPRKSQINYEDLDENLVLFFDYRQATERGRAPQGFEVETNRSSIAHGFGKSFRVRQHADGAQSLGIALHGNALSRVSAERRGNDLFSQTQPDEFQIRIDLCHLQASRRVFAHVVSESFDDSLSDCVVRRFWRAVVCYFVDAIRLEAGNRTGGECAREIEHRFNDAAANRRRRQR